MGKLQISAVLTVSGASGAAKNGNWIPLSTYNNPTTLTWDAIKAGTGDLTYKVQGTLTQVTEEASAIAFDLASGLTASRFGTFDGPLAGIRMIITAGSGAATSWLRVRQAGV